MQFLRGNRGARLRTGWVGTQAGMSCDSHKNTLDGNGSGLAEASHLRNGAWLCQISEETLTHGSRIPVFASPPQAAVGERSSRSASTAAAGGASTFATIAKGPTGMAAWRVGARTLVEVMASAQPA